LGNSNLEFNETETRDNIREKEKIKTSQNRQINEYLTSKICAKMIKEAIANERKETNNKINTM